MPTCPKTTKANFRCGGLKAVLQTGEMSAYSPFFPVIFPATCSSVHHDQLIALVWCKPYGTWETREGCVGRLPWPFRKCNTFMSLFLSRISRDSGSFQVRYGPRSGGFTPLWAQRMKGQKIALNSVFPQFNGILSSRPAPDLGVVLPWCVAIGSVSWRSFPWNQKLPRLGTWLTVERWKCGNTDFGNSLSKAKVPLFVHSLHVPLYSVYNDSYFAHSRLNRGFIKVSESTDYFAAIVPYWKAVEGLRLKVQSCFFSKCPALEMLISTLLDVKHMQIHPTQLCFAGLLNT